MEQAATQKNNHEAYAWVMLFSTLYAVASLPFLGYLLHTNNLIDYLLVSDFQNTWTGAKLALENRIDVFFDFPAYQKELPMHPDGGISIITWSYPLHFLLMIFPLGWLSYPVASLVWVVAGLAITVYLGYLYARPVSKWLLVLLALSPACLANMWLGQTGFLTAAFFMGGLYLLRKSNPIAAGILFGLLTFKPQMGILVPFVLIALKDWKAFISAGVTTVLLLGISVWIWGLDAWHSYFGITDYMYKSHVEFSMQSGRQWMCSIYASLRGLMPFAPAMWLQTIISLIVGTCVIERIYRHGLNHKTVLLLAIASLIVTPYAHSYDMMVIPIALIAYINGRIEPKKPSFLFAELPGLALLWSLPLLTFYYQTENMPMAAIILLVSFGWVYGQNYNVRPEESGK